MYLLELLKVIGELVAVFVLRTVAVIAITLFCLYLPIYLWIQHHKVKKLERE